MSNKPKILFAGCSFTAHSGFTEENQNKYHWPYLFSTEFNCNFDNVSVGGASNDEIFLRTIDALVNKNYCYDLVIVLWTSMGRNWRYFTTNNVDDFSIIRYNETIGFVPSKHHEEMAKQYQKIHYAYFNNQYVELKHWLLKVIALEQTLKNNNVKYIFAKGSTNLIDQFSNVRYNAGQGFLNITDELKNILDFDNRPDDYILSKITAIQNLIDSVDASNFVGFRDAGFKETEVDKSDNGSHPGILSNRNLAEKLIIHCNNKQLLTRS